MKNILLLSIFLFTGAAKLQAQELKGVISQTKEGNIFRPAVLPVSDSLVKSLFIFPGFTISIFAKGLGKPRMMTVTPGGNIYVTNRDAGTLTLIKDINKDGKADYAKIVAQKNQLHGIAYRERKMYVVTVKDLYSANILEDGTLDTLVLIAGNLPDGGQHGNRTIHFGPDSLLYLSVGSTCNSCSETNKRNATLLQINLNDSNHIIYAKGLRNTIGFDWHPQTKELWGFDHGIDWLGDNDQPEELNLIKKDTDYGWPYVYGDYKFDKHHDPSNGQTHVEYAKHTVVPVLLYTAHAAPMDLLFYTGKQFPQTLVGDAFVTMHGSWNRNPASGYKIVRIRFNNGIPEKIEDFVSGFLVQDGNAQFGRVCGLAQYIDGSLLVSDDENGIVYRISYEKSVTAK